MERVSMKVDMSYLHTCFKNVRTKFKNYTRNCGRSSENISLFLKGQ